MAACRSGAPGAPGEARAAAGLRTQERLAQRRLDSVPYLNRYSLEGVADNA